MAATSLLSQFTSPNDVVDWAAELFPELKFEAGEAFAWASRHKAIIYAKTWHNIDQFIGSLFHEIGHSQLNHLHFQHDIALLAMERDAWAWAADTLKTHHFVLDGEHVDNSLDTYREWLYKRAKCPSCSLVGFQTNQRAYHCIHCQIDWHVSRSRLCAVKRRVINK